MKRIYTREHPLLTIEGLSVSFSNNLILRDVNLRIDDLQRPDMNQGQVVAVLGPSGCGKTQLFKCISGLMQPSAGKILLNEERKPVTAGEVGFVFQNYPLLPHRTILQNLMLAANNAGKSRKEVDELLAEFGLADKVNNFPSQLSGGQRQRISIMQQILCSEHFLLMDEPFSGLDVVSKQKMMNLILQISMLHEHNTIILTTHDVEAAVSIADTIWVLGYEKDATGARKAGCTVVKELDLIERGLAWNPEVRHHSQFAPTCEELYHMFGSM